MVIQQRAHDGFDKAHQQMVEAKTAARRFAKERFLRELNEAFTSEQANPDVDTFIATNQRLLAELNNNLARVL
jgi:hypothetical protein